MPVFTGTQSFDYSLKKPYAMNGFLKDCLSLFQNTKNSSVQQTRRCILLEENSCLIQTSLILMREKLNSLKLTRHQRISKLPQYYQSQRRKKYSVKVTHKFLILRKFNVKMFFFENHETLKNKENKYRHFNKSSVSFPTATWRTPRNKTLWMTQNQKATMRKSRLEAKEGNSTSLKKYLI